MSNDIFAVTKVLWFKDPVNIPAPVRCVIERMFNKTLVLHFRMPSLLGTRREWDQEIRALFDAHPDVKYVQISCTDDYGNHVQGCVDRRLHVQCPRFHHGEVWCQSLSWNLLPYHVPRDVPRAPPFLQEESSREGDQMYVFHETPPPMLGLNYPSEERLTRSLATIRLFQEFHENPRLMLGLGAEQGEDLAELSSEEMEHTDQMIRYLGG